jgi:hypothetical protein
MKKVIFLIIAMTLAYSAVWGQAKPNSKIYDVSNYGNSALKNAFSGKKAYYFYGFDFNNYIAKDPSLKEITAAEIKSVIVGDSTIKATKAGSAPYSIIGYSQGGLRALAYIKQLEVTYPKNPEYINQIDAVITVSGIDQGLKMLDGGLGAFKNRASQKVNILGNGLRAAVGICDVFYIFGSIIPRDKTADALTIIMRIIPPNWRSYWAEAWVSTDPKKVPQIGDMVPKSDYIIQNVAKYVNHDYKVKTGTRLASEWRYKTVLGIKIWYIWIGNVDVYSYYTAYEAVPQFNSKVPLGFIVGTNNKTLGMSEDESAIRNSLRAAEITFGVVEGIHIAKCVAIIGLLSGSVTYAEDACEAKKMMGNFDRALDEIKGSSQSDGLVAIESQYIPQTFKNPNTNVTKTILPNPVLGGNSTGYVPFNYYHNQMEQKNVFEKAAALVENGVTERKKQGLTR